MIALENDLGHYENNLFITSYFHAICLPFPR